MRKLVLTLCIILAAVLGTPAAFADEAAYSDARKLLDQQDFAAARDAFGALEDYEDSHSYMLYASARQYEKNGYFEQAGALFAKIAGFLDVDARAAALVVDDRMYGYQGAAKLENQGELSGAIAAFEALGDYMDSEARAAALRGRLAESPEETYAAAKALMEKGDDQRAMALFASIEGYRDSLILGMDCQLRWREETYAQAQALEQDGEAEKAGALYRALGDYRDSADRASAILGPAESELTPAPTPEPTPEPTPGLATAEFTSDGWFYYLDEAIGKYGYMDASGTTVLEPAWDEARQFSFGLAVVRKDGKYGYIDERGQYVTQPVYDKAGDAHYGYAEAELAGTKTLVTRNGALLSGYEYALDAGEDMLYYRQNGAYGYLDLLSGRVTAARFSMANEFSEGLACVEDAAGDFYNFIDRNGDYAFDARFVVATGFEGGTAYAYYDDDFPGAPAGPLEGFIDRTGAVVRPMHLEGVGSGGYSDGLAVWYNDSQNFFINEHGAQAFAGKFDHAGSFLSGCAIVGNDEKYGIIDTNGGYLVQPEYRQIYRMDDGWISLIKDDEHQGLADADGRIVMEPDFQLICELGEGRRLIKKDDLYGFADEDSVVIPPQYEKANGFSEGLAPVQQGGLWGFINSDGSQALPFQFAEQPGRFRGSLSLVTFDNGERAYIDRDGRRVKSWKEPVAQTPDDSDLYEDLPVDYPEYQETEGIDPGEQAEDLYDDWPDMPYTRGDKGSAVKRLQKELISLNYLFDEADGVYGEKTEQAVEEFQSDNSLDRTGQLDPTTCLSLFYCAPDLNNDNGLGAVIPGWARWENSGSALKFQLEIGNVSGKTIEYVEVALYAMDAEGNRLGDPTSYYTSGSEITIKPGRPKFTGYAKLPNRKRIDAVQCGIHEVRFTDGTSAYVDLSEVEFFNWTIR